jgi:RNA polymerase sigma-70 factor (ECF subfamily)
MGYGIKLKVGLIRRPYASRGRGSAKTLAEFVIVIMAQAISNEVLLTQVAEHDEDALGELYDRLAPGLLGLLVHILPNRAMAEEVLQEVFLRLWVEARRWGRERVSVPAVLVLMARNKSVDRLRAERSRTAKTLKKDEAGLKFISWLPRPEEIGLLDGRRDLFKKVINQLPKPQREMLDLAVFQGYTETELSEKLGEPLAKVRSGLLAGVGFVRHRLAAVMRTWAANI